MNWRGKIGEKAGRDIKYESRKNLCQIEGARKYFRLGKSRATWGVLIEKGQVREGRIEPSKNQVTQIARRAASRENSD